MKPMRIQKLQYLKAYRQYRTYIYVLSETKCYNHTYRPTHRTVWKSRYGNRSHRKCYTMPKTGFIIFIKIIHLLFNFSHFPGIHTLSSIAEVQLDTFPVEGDANVLKPFNMFFKSLSALKWRLLISLFHLW